MAAGVCALTSDIPENLEVVAGAGFTFKRGDRSDLTRVLDLLIRNPALRREMAVKGAQQVQEKYLWCDIARSVEQAYYEILEWDRPADVLVTEAKRGSSVA